ncbi:PREDICTED: uncharacterized protein LOC106109128 [Papilio polytes]|uniref:uncharacterized protein LOC106109128 n=1 Tax=Papilio polytes TaxID=76194 RepID=UPI00067634D2|nr:PREDICTED: uncharacterized protein LOC106109128 [Papilio polytes]
MYPAEHLQPTLHSHVNEQMVPCNDNKCIFTQVGGHFQPQREYSSFSLVYSTKSDAANFIVPKQLTPVHGLFVKPSEDGTTGDLYVAASEDSGVDSQWLTEHPINFLPASTQAQKTVVTSPPVKYAYALPIPGMPDTKGFSPYPFGLYAPHNYKAAEESQCQLEGLMPPTSLPAYPYPFYYPHMMAALTATLNPHKEEENDGASRDALPIPQHWPGYAYPYQYIVLDPAAWAQTQTTTTGKITTEEAEDD